MRKSLSIILLGLSVYANARQISPDEAILAASEFLSSSELRTAVSVNSTLSLMKAPGVDKNTAVNPYYIFNRGENDGFVIISSDDRAPKILGYSDKGKFDCNNLPPQLSALLKQFARKIETLPASTTPDPSWNKTSRTAYNNEGILLPTANWGQGYPYNLQTPIVDGEHCPTGCVATAMAIVMKYHNWPDKTTGNAYTNFNFPDQSFDFSDYTIDWDILDDPHNSGFSAEISQLMVSAGVVANMNYTSVESDAELWPVSHLLTESYSYSPDCQFIEREYFSDKDWTEMLIGQLQSRLPVIYAGFNDNSSVAHCFVIDGIDSDGLYHVNWGWDGTSNGYFSLDALNGYSNHQSMILNIRPDRSGASYSRCFIPNADVYGSDLIQLNGWNFSSSTFVPGKRYELSTPFISMPTDAGVQFHINLAVVNDRDQILELIGTPNQIDNTGFCAHPGSRFEMLFTTPGYEMADGLRFQLVSKESRIGDLPAGGLFEPSGYLLVTGGIINPAYFTSSGNPSDMVEIRYHFDESAPIVFTPQPSDIPDLREDYFTRRLKGTSATRNIYIPTCDDLTMRIEAKDRDGKHIEPVYVDSWGDPGRYEFNISLFADEYDLFFDYIPNDDTRHITEGMIAENVVTADGLVYYLSGNSASLIGYDDSHLSSSIVIPAAISFGGKDIPVTHISENALLHSAAEYVTIGPNVAEISRYAFCDMKLLKDISFSDEMPDIPVEFNSSFLDFSPLKSVFIPNGNLIKSFWGPICVLEQDKRKINGQLVSIYMSDVSKSDVSWPLADLLTQLSWLPDDNDRSFTVFVPGLNGHQLLDLEITAVKINEMFAYNINWKKCLIEISPLISNLTVDNIIINGKSVELQKDGKYPFDPALISALDVTVNYTIDGRHSLSTHYDAGFNLSAHNEIILNPSELTLYVGSSADIEATFISADVADKSVTWTSSDESVATVDAEGNVTAVAVGEADITATCGNVSATCKVTVLPILVESLTIDPTEWNGVEGSEFIIKATVLPENAKNKSLTFESSNTSVATVDAEGNVKVLKEGSCVITVSTVDGSDLKAECVVTGLSGVEAIFAEPNALVDVYDMNGVMLKKGCSREELKQLKPAVYILRSSDTVVKAVVK